MKACFSSKFEYNAVISYLFSKRKECKKIRNELTSVHGSYASSCLPARKIPSWVVQHLLEDETLRKHAFSNL